MRRTERLVNCRPVWFDQIIDGKLIFGRVKDRLVLEIILLGGLLHLKEQGKLKFSRNAKPVLMLSVAQLRNIKRELQDLKRRGLESLSSKGAAYQVSSFQRRRGAISFRVSIKKTRTKAD